MSSTATWTSGPSKAQGRLRFWALRRLASVVDDSRPSDAGGSLAREQQRCMRRVKRVAVDVTERPPDSTRLTPVGIHGMTLEPTV